MKTTRNPQLPRRGFTLIELLIVVAIIAILAAIAVPNFLEAQTRAKVSRAKADMRSIATAIEAYRIDFNAYPHSFVDAPFGDSSSPALLYATFLVQLTSPVSYMTNLPRDSFMGDRDAMSPLDPLGLQEYFDYRRTFQSVTTGGEFTIDEIATGSAYNINVDQAPGTSWLLYSVGPDREQNINTMIPSGGFGEPMGTWPYYDATNGTISAGDIIRSPEGDDTTLAGR
jgi:prepilin-type N-terminal cleavage/methylation domain-containing protein